MNMDKKTGILKTDSSHDMLAEPMRRAQEQLEELKIVQKAFEDIFLSTVKNNADLIALINRDMQFRYVSPSSSVITGFRPDELLGRSCLEHLHTDDVEQTVYALSEITEKGRPHSSVQFRVRHKNGAYIHIEAAAMYLPNALDFGSIILHYRNITEQKQSALQIIQQKQFYEAILDTIYDGVCVTDSSNAVSYINKAFLRIMAMAQGDVIGRDIMRFFCADPAHLFHTHYRQAFVTRSPVHFNSLLAATAKGADIFLSGWCIPRYVNGAFDGSICTFTDISEQQKIKEQLSNSEARFRSIAETATDGIITVQTGGEIIFWNRAASCMFGYTEHEVIGKDIFSILPENIMSNHKKIFSRQEKSPAGTSVGRTIEGWAKRKNGAIFPIELSLASWRIAGDIYFTAIVRDITQRKHIEQSLQHSEQELKNLSSRLLQAQEQERKRIAYELHDGLGQILSAAKIGVKTLLGGNKKPPGPGRKQSADNLLANIQSAIDEVRRISRDLRPTILDDLGIIAAIHSFCRDFEKVNSPMTVSREIEARDEEIPEHLTIVIYRVTQEACANIVRHSHAGAVTVKLTSVSGALQLSIHDNGRGFDVEAIQAIKESRRGLGLSSMKERVEFSGGVFTLASLPGQGTTVQALWQPNLIPA